MGQLRPTSNVRPKSTLSVNISAAAINYRIKFTTHYIGLPLGALYHCSPESSKNGQMTKFML